LNILFVCSRNRWRSTTAEQIYKNRSDHKFRSAGTEPSAVRKLSGKDIVWADIIFAVEKKHKLRIRQNFRDDSTGKKIVILDIVDEYLYMDPELIDMIKVSVDPYLI